MKFFIDSVVFPTLWVGTSLGSIISIALNLPTGSKEARKTEPVSVNPSGTIFRLKGAILCMSFLDCNGNLLPSTYEAWRDDVKDRSSKNIFYTYFSCSLSAGKV